MSFSLLKLAYIPFHCFYKVYTTAANLIGTTVGVAVTVLIVVAVSATFVLAILLKKG